MRAYPVLLSAALAACSSPPAPPAADAGATGAETVPVTETVSVTETVRIAVFNIWELSREKLDEVDESGAGTNPQLRGAAEILQRVRPDAVLVNEIDYDAEGRNAGLFAERYLSVAQNGQEPIEYPHVVFEPSNTGYRTGLDMNRDGIDDGPDDAYGFGQYPGQYAMALFSRHPIERADLRTFRKLLWREQPGNLMPDGTDGKPSFYGPEQAEIFRLSSKSHWDVPVRFGGHTIHLLASHPTPSVFDDEEDRNGRRNFDEIRLWADYLSGGDAAAYLVDDQGRRGGLDEGSSFVVLGDLNADPFTDEGLYGTTAIGQLLEHPRVQDPMPRAPGGVAVEREYPGPKDTRTSSWGRIDYVLPSRDLEVTGTGIFWPAADDPLHRLVAGRESSSDHRLVWIDVRLGAEG